MKKLSFFSVCLYILFTILSHGALGQNKTEADKEKAAIESSSSSLENRPSFGEEFSPKKSKAIKDFSKSVKFASNQRWSESIDGFVVKFEDKNGIKCRADYDKKGRWIANTRYYGEKELPKDVRARVKSNYYDFTIVNVQELTFQDHLVYLVQMVDDTKWLTIRICDGEMDIYSEILK